MDGTVYYLAGEPWAWLFPAITSLGIVMQIAAAILAKRWFLITGFLCVCFGCLIERDASLLAGDSLAVAGLWVCLKPAGGRKGKRR